MIADMYVPSRASGVGARVYARAKGLLQEAKWRLRSVQGRATIESELPSPPIDTAVRPSERDIYAITVSIAALQDMYRRPLASPQVIIAKDRAYAAARDLGDHMQRIDEFERRSRATMDSLCEKVEAVGQGRALPSASRWERGTYTVPATHEDVASYVRHLREENGRVLSCLNEARESLDRTAREITALARAYERSVKHDYNALQREVSRRLARGGDEAKRLIATGVREHILWRKKIGMPLKMALPSDSGPQGTLYAHGGSGLQTQEMASDTAAASRAPLSLDDTVMRDVRAFRDTLTD